MISEGVDSQDLESVHRAELGQGHEQVTSTTDALSMHAVARTAMGARCAEGQDEQRRGVGVDELCTTHGLRVRIALGYRGGLKVAQNALRQERSVALMNTSSNNRLKLAACGTLTHGTQRRRSHAAA